MEADDLGNNKRQRFYIELKPDQTTIVSWKRLLRDSSIGPDPDSDPSLFPPPRYVTEAQDKTFQVDKSTTHDGLFRHYKELECMNEPIFSSNYQSGKRRKRISKSPRKKGDDLVDNKHTKPDHVKMNTTLEETKLSQQMRSIKPSSGRRQVRKGPQLNNLFEDVKDVSTNSDVRHQKHQRSNTSNQLQVELHSENLKSNHINVDFSPKVSHRDKNGRHELPDLNLPHCTTQSVPSQENSVLREQMHHPYLSEKAFPLK